MTPTYPARALTAHELTSAECLRSIYWAEQLAAAIAIVVLLPIGLLVAITIFVLSRRGPMVRHTRVGQYGNPIAVLKFRTMWNGTEPPLPFFSLEDISRNAAPEVKSGDDPRVRSRFAAFCRRHSLDELPQLCHVARGEMSLVGPRPLTAIELDTWYGPAAPMVLSLRPGLTGLWQVKGRNRLTYPQRKRLDVFLARHASAGLYFAILLRTVPKVFFGEDAW